MKSQYVWIYSKKIQCDIVENNMNIMSIFCHVTFLMMMLAVTGFNRKMREGRSSEKPLPPIPLCKSKVRSAIIQIWRMAGGGRAVGGCSVVTGWIRLIFQQHFLPDASQLALLLSLSHSPDSEAWHNSYWFANTLIKKMYVSCLFLSSSFCLLPSLHFLSFCSTHWMSFSEMHPQIVNSVTPI